MFIPFSYWSQPTPSITATPAISTTPGITNTPSITVTPSISVTPSITATPSVTPTISISVTPTRTVTPSITVTPTPTTSQPPILTCGNWYSEIQAAGTPDTFDNYIGGIIDFAATMFPGETINPYESDVAFFSYTTYPFGGVTFTGPFGPEVQFIEGQTFGYFGTEVIYQGANGNPAYSLRFTGTIVTDYPRTLIVDTTSVYGTYTAGLSPRTDLNDCPTTTTTPTPTPTRTATPSISITPTRTVTPTPTRTVTPTPSASPPEAGITLSVSNTSAALACALYGDPGNEVYYYLDDPIWVISYAVYQNPQETLFAPANFWYCDGVYARFWDGTAFVGLPVEC